MLLVFYIYTFLHLNLIRSQLNLVWAKNLPKPAWLYYCRLVYYCSCYINLGLVNHWFVHRGFSSTCFFKVTLTLNPCRLIASVIISITAACSIAFKDRNEDEEVWTLETAEDILLRWSVLFYCFVFALWFLLNLWLRKRSAKGSVLRGFSLGATAGSMAGNMWCTRLAAVFAADCASAHVCGPWGHWLPWLVLTGAVFFAAANVPYMAKGMKKYEALYIVTVFQGSNIIYV